jgi:hypothetical protein
VKNQLRRRLVTSLLTLLAAASGFLFYFDVSLGQALANMIRGLGVKVGNAAIPWDAWFFLGIFVISVFSIVMRAKQEAWGKFPSLLAFGASLAWAIFMVTLPEVWLDKVFSVRMDRWAAVLTAVLLGAAFALVFGRKPSNDSRQVEAAC